MKKSRLSWDDFRRFYILTNLAASFAAVAVCVVHLILFGIIDTVVERFTGISLSGSELVITISGGLMAAVALFAAAVVIVLLYRRWRERLTPAVPRMLGIAILALSALFTVLMFFADGNAEGSLVMWFGLATLNFFPLTFACLLSWSAIVAILAIVLLTGEMVYAMVLLRWKPRMIILLPCILCFALMAAACCHLYANRPAVRYGGHGFRYMSGFSSTDFTDYTVFSDSGKLAELDEPAALQISENYPIMDGAEACYPLYAAAARAVYVGIEDIEAKFYAQHGFDRVWDENYEHCKLNGEIVQFSNTVQGFSRLVYGEADLFFGARPSQKDLEWTRDEDIELNITPIGKEGFVFFVEADNPVDSLTSAQVKDIYAGKITNWAEVGGRDEEIVAFQRPQSSGSQTMMEYFMGDIPLQEPKRYETADAMALVIDNVAQYYGEAGAMGYTFRYFLEELNQEEGVKLLAIDGVLPTVENIRSGEYPVVADLCLITRADSENPNVPAMVDFMLSPQGQELVEKTGYAPLG